MRRLLGSKVRVALSDKQPLLGAPLCCGARHSASAQMASKLGFQAAAARLARWGTRLVGLAMIGMLMSCSTALQFARAPSPERVAAQALEAASVPAGVIAPDVEGRLALARRDYAKAATFYEMSRGGPCFLTS